MSSLTIGDLVGYIRADGSDFERGLARSQLRMEGFQLDVDGRLRDISGQFVDEAQVMGRALATGFTDAEREGTRITTVFDSVADAQSRTLRARARQVHAAAQQMGRSFRQAFRQVREAWDRLNFDRLGRITGGVLRVAGAFGKVGAAIGAAVPLAAGLAAAVENMAPAAALAVSALIAVRLAAGAVKLGMVGVGDAVSAALDPSKAEDFAEALKKLSPEARKFALQVKSLAPEFRKLQRDVQNRLFDGLDKTLKSLAKSALPVLRKGLLDSAGALNAMAKGAAAAGVSLAKSGTLGKALDGATAGLSNLRRAPGQVVTALGQLGAAAAPAFSRLTAAAGKAMDRFAEAFTRAFESGALTKAIDQAVSLIGDLATVIGNVFKILGNVFGAAEASGGGFLGVLKEITGQLADAFGSPEIQSGLKAIFGVMSELGKAIGPILISVLKTVAQVFTVLGPPVRELVKHLGAGLLRIANALGPVVIELGKAFATLITAALPLVDLAADLLVAILPALTPLFTALTSTIESAAPVVAELAKAAGALLLPILTTLATQVLPQLIPPLTEMSNRIFPILQDVLVELGPSLGELGAALAELLVAATPLIVKFLELTSLLLVKLLPVIAPLISGLAQLVSGGLHVVSEFITRYVIPAVRALAALLNGDVSGALDHAKNLARNMAADFANSLARLRDRGSQALNQLKDTVRRRTTEMGQDMVRAISQKITEAVSFFRTMPSRIRGALGSVGNLLYSAGQAVVRGFINGISSMVGALKAKLRGITSSLPSWKGPETVDARILVPAGQAVLKGFMGGIASQVPALRRQLGGITAGMPGMALGAAGGTSMAAPRPTIIQLHGTGLKDVIRDIVQTDGGDVQVTFGR